MLEEVVEELAVEEVVEEEKRKNWRAGTMLGATMMRTARGKGREGEWRRNNRNFNQDC